MSQSQTAPWWQTINDDELKDLVAALAILARLARQHIPGEAQAYHAGELAFAESVLETAQEDLEA